MRISRSITINTLSWKKKSCTIRKTYECFPFFLYSSRLVTCIHQVYDAYHNQNSCEVLVSDIVKHESCAKTTWKHFLNKQNVYSSSNQISFVLKHGYFYTTMSFRDRGFSLHTKLKDMSNWNIFNSRAFMNQDIYSFARGAN